GRRGLAGRAGGCAGPRRNRDSPGAAGADRHANLGATMAITTDYALRDSAPAQAAARASSVANGDFDTFLKMLTTQIANQDPLNPMEGSDFAVQLATFSGVEQQARTNQLIEALASRMGVSGLSQLSGWIGR